MKEGNEDSRNLEHSNILSMLLTNVRTLPFVVLFLYITLFTRITTLTPVLLRFHIYQHVQKQLQQRSVARLPV